MTPEPPQLRVEWWAFEGTEQDGLWYPTERGLSMGRETGGIKRPVPSPSFDSVGNLMVPMPSCSHPFFRRVAEAAAARRTGRLVTVADGYALVTPDDPGPLVWARVECFRAIAE